MKVDDVLTFIGYFEDIPYLTSQFLDVNMRLFRTSESYKKIILVICNEIKFLALSYHEGYGQPFGMSGANIGIPLNIIGIVHNRKTFKADCEIMINPEIMNFSKTKTIALSNCGSIRLEKSIQVYRYDWVEVAWFDEKGSRKHKVFTKEQEGFTVQHEIDHNQGILITGREIK